MPYDRYLGEGHDTSEILKLMVHDPSSGIDLPAAILLETVQGEGGLTAASKQWVECVAKIARSVGALLIIDDIQAGCGRTGSFFSFEPFDIKPDIITMAKSISGYGLPMSLVLVDPEFDCLGPGEHNGTFRGNSHAFATAKAAIDKFWIDDTFLSSFDEKEQIIIETLQSLSNIIENSQLKGRGLFRGIDVLSGQLANKICGTAFENGLILETSGSDEQVIKILAALTISKDELKNGLDILSSATETTLQSSNLAAE